jgi:WD repeat-containing protein 45
LHIFETYQNPKGIGCLCSHSINSNLAYLGMKPGNVSIIDLANTEKSPIEIMAHETAISYMTLSSEGTKLATASTKVTLYIEQIKKKLTIYIYDECLKGTLIRVFDTESGILLHELRRGANNATIYW